MDDIARPENYQSVFESHDMAVKAYMANAMNDQIGADPSPDVPYLVVNGVKRYLAATQRENNKVYGSFPRFKPGLVDPKDYKDTSLLNFIKKRYNQSSQSSCVGHGTVAGCDIAIAISGQTPVILSPCFTYGLVNGGRDNGANTGEGVQSTIEVGCCLESTVGPMQIWKSRFPAAAFTEAKRFRMLETEAVSTFAEVCSAIMYARPVVIGTFVGNRFNPDGQGILPDLVGRTGGHCMCVVGIKFLKGTWYLEVLNSWGADWGVNGVCYMPISYVEKYTDMFEGYAMKTSAIDPQDSVKPLAA